jgi:hypothetical protein
MTAVQCHLPTEPGKLIASSSVSTLPFFSRMLARIMLREVHANVNTGVSLDESLREIDERRVKA